MDVDRRGMLQLCGIMGLVGGCAGCLRLEGEDISEGDGEENPGDEGGDRTERQEDTEEQTEDTEDTEEQTEVSDDQTAERDDPTEEFLERFRVIVENETDVEINSLQVEENYVELDYESEFTLESQDGTDEVIEIASAYARVVRAGWEVDFLHSELQASDGDQHVFRIRTETALDWAEGQISDDEWRERILDNVQPR